MLLQWVQSGLQAAHYAGVIRNGGAKSRTCLLQYGREGHTEHDGFGGRTSLGGMQKVAGKHPGKTWPNNATALAKRLDGFSIVSLLYSAR